MYIKMAFQTKIVVGREERLPRIIDDDDKKILRMLSENPELSQAELSKQLRISQPAVSARMRKLEESGTLARLVGTDVKKSQLFLARVNVSTNNVESVLKFLDTCPLYLNSFLTSGRHNLTIFLLGENIRSIMSCVDSHIRQNLPVRNLEFDLIVTPIRSFVVPIKPNIDKKRDSACGADCGVCTFYSSERCLGCPASVHYRGNLL
jgi:Lrp/AsnC family leucine-responsive transcriptional regulator